MPSKPPLPHNIELPVSRRTVFAALLAGGSGVAAGWHRDRDNQSATATGTLDTPTYRVTAHVRRYYELARS